MKKALMGLCVLMVLFTAAWGDETKKVLGQRISGPTKHDPVAYRTEVEKRGQPGRFQAVRMDVNSLAVIDTVKGYVWMMGGAKGNLGIVYLGDLFPVDESFTWIHFKVSEKKTDDVPIGAPVPNK